MTNTDGRTVAQTESENFEMPRDSFEAEITRKMMAKAEKEAPKKNDSGEDIVLNLEYLSELLVKNEERTKDITDQSDIVLVVGSHGAGKSTFLQLISGQKMKAEFDDAQNRRFTFAEGEGDERFEVGHGLEFMTDTVGSHFSDDSAVFYIDTPGFDDNRHTEIDIATSISLQKICAKAKRIRFVVIINAYACFNFKTAGLKNDLDHVQKFIGSNFKDYRKSFTVLFTKCTSAFPSISKIDLSALDTEGKLEVINTAKSQLKDALNGVDEYVGTTQSLKKFVQWLVHCINKGTHYCEILDPIITDIPHMKERLEPSFPNQDYIKGADGVIRVNLDTSAAILLEKELERRTRNLKFKIEENFRAEFSEQTRSLIAKDSLDLCKIACFIGIPKCKETALEVLTYLHKTYTSSNYIIGEAINNQLDATGESAKSAKLHMGHVKFLDGVLKECVSYLEENMGPSFDKTPFGTESEKVDDVLKHVERNFDGLERTLMEAENSYLMDLSNKNQNIQLPDFEMETKKMRSIKDWAHVFKEELEPKYLQSSRNMMTTLTNTANGILNYIKGDEDVFKRGQIAVRGVQFFSSLENSHLIETIARNADDDQVAFWGNDKYSEYIKKCTDFIKTLPLKVRLMTRKVLSSNENNVHVELSQAFEKMIDMNNFIAKERISSKIGENFPLTQSLRIVQEEGAKENKICFDLINGGLETEGTSEALEPRIKYLSTFVNCLPPTLVETQRLAAKNTDLQKKLESALNSLKSKMELLLGSVESGVDKSDADNHKTHLIALKKYIWFDEVMTQNSSLEEPFVKKELDRYAVLYDETATKLFGTADTTLTEVLSSNKMQDEVIQEKTTVIKSSIEKVENVRGIISASERESAISISSYTDKIAAWCSQNDPKNIPAVLQKDDLEKVHKTFLIASLLKPNDAADENPLSSLITGYEQKLKGFSEYVKGVMNEEGSFDKKKSFMESAQIWSKLSTFSTHLPSYTIMQASLKNQIEIFADVLFKSIGEADVADLGEVEKRLGYLDSAQEHIDGYVDAHASQWKSRCVVALQKRNDETNEVYGLLVEEKNYEEVKKYLSNMKKQPNSKAQYMKSCRLLSVSLKSTLETLKGLMSSPEVIKRRGEEEVLGVWDELITADKLFNGFIETYPTWKLREGMVHIEANVEKSRMESLAQVERALSELDIKKSELYLRQNHILHSVLGKVSEKFRSSHNKENAVGQYDDTKRSFSRSLQKIDEVIDNYLATDLSGQQQERVSQEGGGLFFQLFGRREEQKGMESLDLIRVLNNVKSATEDEDCSKVVKERYLNYRKRLSEGLENTVTDLRKEYEQGYCTRSIKVLNIIRNELHTKGLDKHVDWKFDLMSEMDKVNAKRAATVTIDRFDHSSIGNVAAIVDKLQNSEVLFHQHEYTDYKNRINNQIYAFRDEYYSKLTTFDMKNVFRRLKVFQEIELKFKRHNRDLQKMNLDIKKQFNDRVGKACKDLEGYAEAKNISKVTDLFYEFHILFLESESFNKTTPIQNGELLLGETMRNLEIHKSNFHLTVHKFITDDLDKLDTEVRDANFNSAAITARDILEIGNFACSSFEFYRAEIAEESKDPTVHKLSSKIKENFSSDEFLVFGKHLGVLRLQREYDENAVTKAFTDQSTLWNPEKHPLDNELALERTRLIGSAKDFLLKPGAVEKYRNYDFKYLSNVLSRIPLIVKEITDKSIERNEYAKIKALSKNISDVEALINLSKQNDGSRKHADQFRKQILKSVEDQAQILKKDIKNAGDAQDFTQLYHSYTALEALEEAFMDSPEIIRKSFCHEVISDLKKNLEDLSEKGMIFATKDEDRAREDMDKFAMQLVKLGRYLDGFPKLKTEAKHNINRLLDRVYTADWGKSFILDLGMKLESGDFSKSEKDQNIGLVLVNDFNQFKDAKVFRFSQNIVKTENITDSLRKTTSFSINREMGMEPSPFNGKNLKMAYEAYSVTWDKYFKEHAGKGYEPVVKEVYKALREVGKVDLQNWSLKIRRKIPMLLAGIYATFSIIKCGDSFANLNNTRRIEAKNKFQAMDIVVKPHNIQIIAILKLLGVGYDDKQIKSHVMEVRTGEGKSIILGGLSILLALLGFSIRTVCYSANLSNRDNEEFADVFKAFGVQNRIKYSTIKEMAENQMEKEGDVRKMTKQLVYGSDSRSSSDKRRDKSRKKTDLAAVDCLDLNGKEILLVDEIDVFFGPDFFGKTHNPVVPIHDHQIAKLIGKVWKERSTITFESLRKSQEFRNVRKNIRGIDYFLNTEIQYMIQDVNNYNDPPYITDAYNARIGYAFRDVVDYKIKHRYRTVFAYLNEYEKGSFSEKSGRAGLKKYLSIWVPCGNMSYTNINPDCVLGVSGTLKDISNEERRIVKDFNIDSYSFLPSVYGKNRLEDSKETRIVGEKYLHFQKIALTVQNMVRIERGVLVFFEDDQRLQEFKDSDYYTAFKHVNILVSASSEKDRDYAVQRAARCGQVTLSTAPFGRGTDFFCGDKKLESLGGLHIIQTFFSMEKSEEIQIKGRTARQGQSGSYEMILLEDDIFKQFPEISSEDLDQREDRIYRILDSLRAKAYGKRLSAIREAMRHSESRDYLSRQYRDALKSGNTRRAHSLFRELYHL